MKGAELRVFETESEAQGRRTRRETRHCTDSMNAAITLNGCTRKHTMHTVEFGRSRVLLTSLMLHERVAAPRT